MCLRGKSRRALLQRIQVSSARDTVFLVARTDHTSFRSVWPALIQEAKPDNPLVVSGQTP